MEHEYDGKPEIYLNTSALVNFQPKHPTPDSNCLFPSEMQQAIDLARNLLKDVWDLHLSIDLETPVKRGHGIFSVGIVPFSQEKKKIFHELAFYARFNFTEVLEKSGFDPTTMRWWLMQDKKAIMEILHTEVKDHTNGRTSETSMKHFGYEAGMLEALNYITTLKKLCRVDATVFPLGNGKEFDVTIFHQTAAHLNLLKKDWKGEELMPWNFWDAKDLRERVSDVQLLSGINLKKTIVREGTHHNAVDDALHQAKMYLAGYEIIEEARKAYKGA